MRKNNSKVSATIEAFELALDLLGSQPDMNPHALYQAANKCGGHDWKAAIAVRNACERGEHHRALDALLSVAKSRLQGSINQDSKEMLMAEAMRFYWAKEEPAHCSDEVFKANGMAHWFEGDMPDFAAVLESALWWALTLDDDDKSICAAVMQKAARLLVVEEYKRVFHGDRALRPRVEAHQSAAHAELCAMTTSQEIATLLNDGGARPPKKRRRAPVPSAAHVANDNARPRRPRRAA